MLLFLQRLGIRAFTAGRWLFQEGRWKFALLVLTALLSALAIRGCTKERQGRAAAEQAAQAAEQQVLAGDQARIAADRAVTGAQAAKAAITKNELAGNARMENVLEANDGWASEPVPGSVLDSLRD